MFSVKPVMIRAKKIMPKISNATSRTFSRIHPTFNATVMTSKQMPRIKKKMVVRRRRIAKC